MLLTPTHLAIVMEYAAGGELFDRICNAGRFSEDEVCLHRWILFCSVQAEGIASNIRHFVTSGKIFLSAADFGS